MRKTAQVTFRKTATHLFIRRIRTQNETQDTKLGSGNGRFRKRRRASWTAPNRAEQYKMRLFEGSESTLGAGCRRFEFGRVWRGEDLPAQADGPNPPVIAPGPTQGSAERGPELHYLRVLSPRIKKNSFPAPSGNAAGAHLPISLPRVI